MDYKGKHNTIFNEKDEVIIALKFNVLMGDIYANLFVCSKCFKEFFLPEQVRKHASRCRFKFSKFSEPSVAYVNKESPRKERVTCELLSRMARRECGWDFPILHSKNWDIAEFSSHVFALTASDLSILCYLLFRHYRKKPRWVLSEIFTPQAYRSKGFATYLLEKALDYLKISEPYIMEPLTDNGYAFLKAWKKKHEELET